MFWLEEEVLADPPRPPVEVISSATATPAAPAAQPAPQPDPNVPREGELPLGSTFLFEDMEITIGDTLGWAEIESGWSDRDGELVFYLPVTVTNRSGETRNFFPWFELYGPSGLELDRISFYFDDIAHMGGMRDGATQDGYMHILYEGDGEYVIVFYDWWNPPIEIVFQVRR